MGGLVDGRRCDSASGPCRCVAAVWRPAAGGPERPDRAGRGRGDRRREPDGRDHRVLPGCGRRGLLRPRGGGQRLQEALGVRAGRGPQDRGREGRDRQGQAHRHRPGATPGGRVGVRRQQEGVHLDHQGKARHRRYPAETERAVADLGDPAPAPGHPRGLREGRLCQRHRGARHHRPRTQSEARRLQDRRGRQGTHRVDPVRGQQCLSALAVAPCHEEAQGTQPLPASLRQEADLEPRVLGRGRREHQEAVHEPRLQGHHRRGAASRPAGAQPGGAHPEGEEVSHDRDDPPAGRSSVPHGDSHP